jgi:hypothetical protein
MIDVIGRPTAILMAFQEKDDDDEPVQGPSDLWSGSSSTRESMVLTRGSFCAGPNPDNSD